MSLKEGWASGWQQQESRAAARSQDWDDAAVAAGGSCVASISNLHSTQGATIPQRWDHFHSKGKLSNVDRMTAHQISSAALSSCQHAERSQQPHALATAHACSSDWVDGRGPVMCAAALLWNSCQCAIGGRYTVLFFMVLTSFSIPASLPGYVMATVWGGH